MGWDPKEAIRAAFSSLDPRVYQIGILATLLGYGTLWLDFTISLGQAFVILSTAQLTQYVCTRIWKLPSFDPKSALISSLSLCLLLRTNSLVAAGAVASITIASKFLLRWDGKHIFNPTNLALVFALYAGVGWVSPGQWGREAFFGFLVACLGVLVVNRAARSDVTYAFLVAYIGILFGRALWLGDPLTIPVHQLQNGALLIFAFFMISDPKTTPNSRAGRVLYACAISLGASLIEFGLYRPNGLLWSLACCSLLVPLIDWIFPGTRYQWNRAAGAATFPLTQPPPVFGLARAALISSSIPRRKRQSLTEELTAEYVTAAQRKEDSMKRHIMCTTLLLTILGWSGSGFAFCGFYVAKADTKLFNKASQVAIVRHDDKTVITMGNDFRGDVNEFAMVIPVPTVLEREQIHIGDKTLLERVDAYSAARLVEYFDPNPCEMRAYEEDGLFGKFSRKSVPEAAQAGRARALGVTIEAQYTVGEYDILILSAKQSHGLETWLRESGYRIPNGASRILASYLKQDMKFFVAKVNLKEHAKLGFTSLRPIQVAFETPKFMLPIRLGTVNADGPQELFIYLITRKGRAETTNYRTIKLPAAKEIPVYVKDKFPDFYRDMFSRQVVKENMRGVFLEYAWNMNWCDPCAANPLSSEELRNLGVFWQKGKGASKGGAQEAYLTRLHVRYDAEHFPEDLFFQETSDRSNFQARYILRHPWKGDDDCPAAKEYRARLRERQEREAQTLAHLTGWNINDIRRSIGLNGSNMSPQPRDKNWWEKIWGN